MTNCNNQFADGWDWIASSCEDQAINIGGIADWQIKNGDLVDGNQLHSAVIIQLFTDKRIDDDNAVDLPLGTNDKRGWWGDYFNDFEIGSLLWTLYRQFLTDEIAQDARRHTRDALKPLIDQGAAASSDAEITIDKENGFMSILPILYGQDGETIYRQEFRRFWE